MSLARTGTPGGHVRIFQPWKVLELGLNQIVDVSALTLPDGLTDLYLYSNQIVDVSALTLPDGLTELDLSGNQIVDSSKLTLPDGCEHR